MADVNWNDFTPVDAAQPQVDWSQYEPIKPTSAPRKLADIATSFAGGALGASKAITDAGGAGSQVSQVLDRGQDAVQGWLSPARQAERANRAQIIKDAEKSGSALQEIGAHLGGIAEAPVSTFAEAAGSVAPIVASMFTPAGRSAAARRLLGVGLGAAQGAGSVKGSIYDSVQQQHLDRGATPDVAKQAAEQAQAYSGPNADNIALGAGIGAVTGTTGVEAIVNRTLAGKAATGGFLRRTALGTVGEGLPEAVQGGQERYSANVAQQRAGFDVPTWQGVAGQATVEGVAGGMVGGVAGGFERGHARRHAGSPNPGQAEAESSARQNAMDAAADAQAKADAIVPPWTTSPGAAGPVAEPVTGAAAAVNAPHVADVDFSTSPGAMPSRENGIDFTREVDTNGLSLVDQVKADAEAASAARHSIDFEPIDTNPAWSTEPGAQAERTGLDLPPPDFDTGDLALDTRTPSQRMGIDPTAGPLSRGAAAAVDSAALQPAQGMQAAQAAVAEPVGYEANAAKRTVGQPSAITPAAQELVDAVDAGGTPAFMTNNLRRVAVENGVAVTPEMTPNDVVTALRQRAAPAEQAPAQTRPENWRTNMMRAGPVAKSLGLDPKGKRLAQVVAEIDAADARLAGVPQDGADLSAGQINQEWSAFAPEIGTLGVPRADMPQIKAEHRGALVNFLKARGIDSTAAEVPANDLKPTQAEFSPAKVQQAREFKGGDRSILVSSDGYVVDGHHQWLAKRANGEPVKVIRLKAPIRDVLAQVAEFPSTAASSGATTADQQRRDFAEAERHRTAPPVSQPKTESVPQASSGADDRIRDFGEKIGGARKDLAEKGTKPTRVREKDDRPAWARRFEVSQIAQSSRPSEEGRWMVRDSRSKDRLGQARQMGRSTFASKEEAEQNIPLLAVGMKHRAVPVRQGEGTGYEIWRDVTDRKRVKVVDQVFPTRDDALRYMADNAQKIIETNTTFGEADLPRPDSDQRIGEARRQGDVKDADFTQVFGFRGVEFGNWNNQSERQHLLNDAYDGLLDLAEVMGIPPRAISLNGELGLAFGARGHGLSGARAHYESNKVVINLTKENGAGSLAHEWFHGLDHYFARQDGKASAEWVAGEDGTRSLKVDGDFEANAVTGGTRGERSGLRAELRDGYAELMRTISRKGEQYVEDTARADRFVAGAREGVQDRLKKIRADLAAALDERYYKRMNKPASAEQLAEFDALAEKIIAGESLDLRVESNPAGRSALSGSRWTNDALNGISAIMKAVRGRQGFTADREGPLDRLRGDMQLYSARLKMLADAQSSSEKTRQVPTQFAMDAKELDQGRGQDYWTTPHEMAARAFQGYVEDKIAERGGKSPFLNHGPANAVIETPWGWKRPFPHGQERVAINSALDKLVGAMKTREDDAGNVALYSMGEQRAGSDARMRFSPEARAQAVASVQQTVDAVRAAWSASPDVIVAFDMNDPVVPASARQADLRQRSGGARGAPEGFYYQGKAYLMASRLRTPNDAARVLFHEVLGHHGLRGVFGEDLDTVLSQIATMRRADVDAKIKEYGLRGVNRLDRRTAAEEVLAEMAQSRPTIGFVKRAVAAIRTWLRENVPGFNNLRMSDDEIVRNFILPARAFVERGVRGADAGGAAAAFNRSGDRTIEPIALHLQGWEGRQAQLRALAGGWYSDNLQGKSFHNDDMGVDVQFSSEGKRTAFATSGNLRMGWRAEMVKALPELVKRAVRVDETAPDARRAHNTKAFHTLVAPLKVNGRVLAAKITLRESLLDPNGKPHKFYDIAAVEIENGPEMSGVAPDVSTGPVHPTGSEPSAVSVSDLAKVINPAEAAGDVRFSRATPAERVGEAIKSIAITNIKRNADFKAADLRPLGLQFLGRRQLVDVYGDMLPEMREYNDLIARMDADKNEAGAGADQLAQVWAKLADEGALADLMHDATLAQMDPAKAYVEGDNRLQYGALRKRFEALTPAAKEVYAKARDTYTQHMQDVRSAIKERIQRAEISSERRAAMLKRLDNEFFGRVKGVYFPLARFGQYVVVVKDADGKVANVSRAETMAEADSTRQQLGAAFPAAKGFSVGKVIKAKDFVAERDSVGRGFMEQLYGVLDKQGLDAKHRAELEDALGQLYLSSLPDLSWAKHGIHRKGMAGFSQDARRAFAQNVFHGASYLAKLRYGDLLQDQLGQMQKRVEGGEGDAAFDSVKAQQVVDEMAKRHDAAMNPKSNALSTALTSFGFMFHLGLSPASAMVNLSQTALVAYPIMGARWGFKRASAALLQASQEAVRGKNDITASLNADEKRAFEEAVRAGVVDVTMAHDLAGIAQGEDRNVSYKLRPVMRAASFLFHHAEKFNRQVTFVAAYRLAREAGADQKAAYEQAVQATYDGHFDYSANNRPRVMQGNVARVLLLFKQYGQNMVYTFARSAQQALKGASPEDRAQARKTLAGLLTTHAMAAGVLGLPMVTTLLAAASMLGGDDDEPWDAQVALQNLLADTFGQKPAEVLAHGLSRLTPWDISGRVGLDKLIFPDVQEGLEGQRLAESAMAAALGPVAGIGVNALKGLQEMSHGRYQLGLETMAPSALRGPLKALRYEIDGVKDRTGIVVQDEVGAAALLGQAAGFSPSSVRNAYEGKSAIVRHDRALQARRGALVERFAMAAMAKDEDGKTEAREAIQRFNEKNPGRRILPMQLAQSVRQREKRIREAEDRVWLPRKRRDAAEAGRFAAGA